LVTFDEVFALAVELGYADYQLPKEDGDRDAQYKQLSAAKHNLESYYASASGLLQELRALGIPLPEWIQQVALNPDPRAVPILIEWLPRIDDRRAKSEVVALLGEKWAQPEGKQALLEEFDRIRPEDDPDPDSTRFRLVSKLAALAKDSDADFFVRVASDPVNGSARLPAAAALGRWKRQREKSVPVLMELLHDDSDFVYWWAAQALGLLREPSAENPIQKRLDAEQDPYKRQKLKTALKRIQAAQ
jgi:HEAT repeat protein